MACGCKALKDAKSEGGQESANEQPAFKSGSRTFFEGFMIFAVSAMKWTPAKTIISASIFAACWAKYRLSPK